MHLCPESSIRFLCRSLVDLCLSDLRLRAAANIVVAQHEELMLDIIVDCSPKSQTIDGAAKLDVSVSIDRDGEGTDKIRNKASN